jgi:hypothetical protein
MPPLQMRWQLAAEVATRLRALNGGNTRRHSASWPRGQSRIEAFSDDPHQIEPSRDVG